MQIQRQYGDSSVVQPKVTMGDVAVILSSNLPLSWSSQHFLKERTKANSPGSQIRHLWTTSPCFCFHWSHPLAWSLWIVLSSVTLQSRGSLKLRHFLSPSWQLKTFLALDLHFCSCFWFSRQTGQWPFYCVPVDSHLHLLSVCRSMFLSVWDYFLSMQGQSAVLVSSGPRGFLRAKME